MNKSLFILITTLFIANVHADILHATTTTNFPTHPGYESVQLEQAMKDSWKDTAVRDAYLKRYNQKTFICSSACATALAGLITVGFISLIEWYEDFKLRKTRNKKEFEKNKFQRIQINSI